MGSIDQTGSYAEGQQYLIANPESFPFNNVILDSSPMVSFCIPTLNNERTLSDCLQSIINQNYKNIEIIIVDGGSIDRTIEISKQFTDKIYYDRGTLGSARQTSVEKSSGKILAIFDSDIVIPHSDWLTNALKYFNAGLRVSTVWPKNIAAPGSSLTSRLYFNQWRSIFEKRMEVQKGYFGGGNSLFLRESLDDIGGISRTFHWGEDYDWAKKLKEKGYSVVYLDDSLIHNTMHNLEEFYRKQFVGADTFAKTGFALMGLSFFDIIIEQIRLTTIDMVKGLLQQKDISWLLSPPFFFLRGNAYFSEILKMKFME